MQIQYRECRIVEKNFRHRGQAMPMQSSLRRAHKDQHQMSSPGRLEGWSRDKVGISEERMVRERLGSVTPRSSGTSHEARALLV